MQVADLKRAIKEFEKYIEDPKWFVITGPGHRYDHNPPYSLLEVDGDCLKSLYYENGNGPAAAPMVIAYIDIADLNTIGADIGKDKHQMIKMLKERHNFTNDEACSLVKKVIK